MIPLTPRLSQDGRIEQIDGARRLLIPLGGAGRYRLAQLDDHRDIPRDKYPYQAPRRLAVEARVSSAVLPGTWGFGLWNDPYGFSFAPGNGFLRLPALPNAAWFFGSSQKCYLTFRDDRPGNGFLAQVFSSPRFDTALIRAALAAPFSLRTTRRLLSRVISEDEVQLAGPKSQGRLDVTQWHTYSIDWGVDQTVFNVDGSQVLATSIVPRGPLGIVIWIDNQFAGFRPNGRLTFGLEANPGPAALDIRGLSLDGKSLLS
jgi:hypothetical protein